MFSLKINEGKIMGKRKKIITISCLIIALVTGVIAIGSVIIKANQNVENSSNVAQSSENEKITLNLTRIDF